MLIRILIGVAIWLGTNAVAHAQTFSALTVTSCGGQSLQANQYYPLTMDLTGKFCNSASSSGAAGQYPVGATPIGGNASGTTGVVVGTLAAAAGKYTYVCDFDVSAIGGTAAVGPVTVGGLVGGTRTYQMSSSVAGVLLTKSFNPCLQSSAQNTAIVITTTADATATAVNVNSGGFQQ